MSETAVPSRRARLIVALTLGSVAALCLAIKIRLRAGLPPTSADGPASDFDQVWFAAGALLRGLDPYTLIGPGRPFPWLWPFLYPASSGIAVLPLRVLPLDAARLVFVGGSMAALAFALSRRAWYPLLVFATPLASTAVLLGQWTPALTASAAFLPVLPAVAALGILAAVKPTVAVAMLAALPLHRLRCRRVWLAILLPPAVIGAMSLILLPTWPTSWFAAARVGGQHLRPGISFVAGPAVLLALLRWRRPEARLLFVLACVPQTFFWYDALPLALVPESREEVTMFVAAAWVAAAIYSLIPVADGDGFRIIGHLTSVFVYLPCLLMVLRRPNVDPTATRVRVGQD
jgi:hypothetical protein